jgi:FKBP-type peptidyl-prolyl cis-trans isomerase
MSHRLLRTVRRLAVALPLLAAAGACSSGRPTEPITRVEETTFAPALNVDLAQSTALPSGVYTRDLTVGEGAAVTARSNVTAHYTLWLSNGQQIEKSPEGRPIQFTLGQGEAIPGFEIGLVGMQPGGRRQILIPPGYAYGARGNGPIPGFAVIVFEVEMLAVE